MKFRQSEKIKINEVLAEIRKSKEVINSTEILQMANLPVNKINQGRVRRMLRSQGMTLAPRGGSHTRRDSDKVIQVASVPRSGKTLEMVRQQIEDRKNGDSPVTRFQESFDNLTLLKELKAVLYMAESEQSTRARLKEVVKQLDTANLANKHLRDECERLRKQVASLNELEQGIKSFGSRS